MRLSHPNSLFPPAPIDPVRPFPSTPSRLWNFLRIPIALVVRAYLRLYHRFTIVGLHHLPADGSFVLVANHASHLDTLCLQAALPLARLSRTHPAAAADYFFTSFARRLAAVVVANALPFHRKAQLRQGLALCRRLLASNGNILILYPEGTRSTDGCIGPFRPGVGSLLADTRVPVIPCHIEGAAGGLAKGRWFPRPRAIRLVIGRPRTYPLVPAGKAGARFVCRDLERAVRDLGRPRDAIPPASLAFSRKES